MSSESNGYQYNPLNHFSYPILDVECGCKFCSNWRDKRSAFDKVKQITYFHHRSCECWRCDQRREFQTEYLAALNKRDVYCELSWHAAKHASTYGPTLMKWAETELLTNQLGTGWWAIRAPYYPLCNFLYKFQLKFRSIAAILVEQTAMPFDQIAHTVGISLEDVQDIADDKIVIRTNKMSPEFNKQVLSSISALVSGVSGHAFHQLTA